MGRACKCTVCGSKLNTDTAFVFNHITKGGNTQRFFFCNEQEYIDQRVKIAMANGRVIRVNEAIDAILGYDHNNSMLFAQEKKWSKDNNMVLVIESHVEELAELMKYKGFDISSDGFHVYKYLSAVINNNMNKWLSELQLSIEAQESLESRVAEHEEVKTKSFQRRKNRCLDDFD